MRGYFLVALCGVPRHLACTRVLSICPRRGDFTVAPWGHIECRGDRGGMGPNTMMNSILFLLVDSDCVHVWPIGQRDPQSP